MADHHAHLKSPAVAALWHVRLPPVALPAALDRVLKDFERHWHARDEAAFAGLFTENGIMQYGDAWRRGRAAIRIAQLDSKGADLKLWAQHFEMGDSLAYVVGSYGHRTRPDLADLGRLHWTLRKERDGVWRIAASMMGNVNPPSASDTATRPARVLIAQLDSAGMRHAAVLSLAYQFGSPMFEVDDEYAKVRAENDWTAQEVARYPGRLVAFCSFNPTRNYALDELERCMRTPGFTGLKLHFTSSFVDLRNPDHVDRLRRVFRAANARRFPIVVHMRTLDRTYGRPDADIFLREILAEGPDVPVQIAHLAGWGGYGPETEQALAVFAEAIATGDRRTANVYFDLTAIAPIGADSVRNAIVERLRQIGLRRLVFGIDLADSTAQLGERWARLMEFPFSAEERRAIAGNVAPYMR
ncbi:MAG TPA: amidohydrolase family protein [Gemmatimonadaceae bacterium]|nr:amidohydrolase family protein [Gemmatimonadaceae bacterium]